MNVLKSEKTEDLFSIKDQVVVITGAGGLGEMYVRAFAENGAKVILLSRTLQKASRIKAEMATLGFQIDSRELELTDKQAVYQTIRQIAADYGTIDTLIHTAASCLLHPVMEDCEEIFRKNTDTNMMGSLFICQAVANVMNRRGSGSIILINTHSCRTVNSPDGMSYSVSKAALEMMTKWFAVELAPAGITVNGIAPIWIHSPLMARRSQDYLDKAIAQVPMGRMSYAEDYLGLGLFLAGGGSRFITGQTFLVDGGWSVSRRFQFEP